MPFKMSPFQTDRCTSKINNSYTHRLMVSFFVPEQRHLDRPVNSTRISTKSTRRRGVRRGADVGEASGGEASSGLDQQRSWKRRGKPCFQHVPWGECFSLCQAFMELRTSDQILTHLHHFISPYSRRHTTTRPLANPPFSCQEAVWVIPVDVANRFDVPHLGRVVDGLPASVGSDRGRRARGTS